MYVVSKKLNENEYIIYLMSETGQRLKAKIINTLIYRESDLEDKIWQYQEQQQMAQDLDA